MYVCNCQGVTDTQVRQAVHQGCTSLKDLRRTLGVASQCGRCACHAKEVLADTLKQQPVPVVATFYPAAMSV